MLFELVRTGPGRGLLWPPHSRLLLKRLMDAGFIVWHPFPGQAEISGVSIAPEVVVLTDKGRAYVDSISVQEL
jgi:hypothetical protein